MSYADYPPRPPRQPDHPPTPPRPPEHPPMPPRPPEYPRPELTPKHRSNSSGPVGLGPSTAPSRYMEST